MYPSVHGPRRRRKTPPATPFPPGSDGDILYQEIWPSVERGSFQSLEEVRNYVEAVATSNPDARHYTALDAVLDALAEREIPDSVREPVEEDDEEDWSFARSVNRAGALPNLLKQLDELNNKAIKRLGTDNRLHLDVNPESETRIHPRWHDIDPRGLQPVPDSFKLTVYGFEILGNPLKVPGWTLIGVITYLEDGSAALTKAPGYEGKIPKRFYDSTPDQCDHCKYCRRRKETFVLWNGKRKYIQVGRNCLKDFLGVDGTQLERQFDLMRALEAQFAEGELGDGGSGIGFGAGPDVPLLVAWGAAIYRKEGWRTAKQVDEAGAGVASASTASDFASLDASGGAGRLKGDSRKEFERLRPEQEDLEGADKALAWIAGLTLNPVKDDYLFKLQQLGRQEHLPYRMHKLMAGLYAAYVRAQEQKKRIRTGSQHVGEVGERGTFSGLKLEFKRSFPSSYQPGPVFQHKFVDPEGNVFVWWASSDPGSEVGETYDVVATVKKHDAFRGENQTVLNRAVLHTPGEAPTRGRMKAGYVGTEGERDLFGSLTMESEFTVETAYGALHILKFRDPNNNLLVWKTSSWVTHPVTDEDIKEGDTVDLVATVKEQTEYRGEKQTVIQRAKVFEAGKGKAPKKKKKGGTTSGIEDDKYCVEGRRLPWVLQGLAAEARKAPSFEDFRKDYLIQIKHGLYWHWTEDPDFTIDPEKGPQDMSSLGSGGITPGQLMITSDLDAWSHYGMRAYAALIDMREVPRTAYYQVNRGFGNEFMVLDPSEAKVDKVYPRAAALRFDRAQDEYKPGSEDKLREFYDWAVSEGGTTSGPPEGAVELPTTHAEMLEFFKGFESPRTALMTAYLAIQLVYDPRESARREPLQLFGELEYYLNLPEEWLNKSIIQVQIGKLLDMVVGKETLAGGTLPLDVQMAVECVADGLMATPHNWEQAQLQAAWAVMLVGYSVTHGVEDFAELLQAYWPDAVEETPLAFPVDFIEVWYDHVCDTLQVGDPRTVDVTSYVFTEPRPVPTKEPEWTEDMPSSVVTIEQLRAEFAKEYSTEEQLWDFDDPATYGYAYDEAIEEDHSEEEAEEIAMEAEAAARDEQFREWYRGVLGAAEDTIKNLGMVLYPLHGEHSMSFFLRPGDDWLQCVDFLVELINGVGMFSYEDGPDACLAGPYTPRQFIISHWGWGSYYHEVYG